MIHFSKKQEQAIEYGQIAREQLLDRIQDVVAFPDTDLPHSYISSPAGLGKTHEVSRALKNANVEFHTVGGNVSLWMFAVKLAVIAHTTCRSKQIFINVDDCDGILGDIASINVLKNVLEAERVLRYEVDLRARLGGLTELQREAIDAFQNSEGTGFTIPCDNMTFIFTSNIRLPYKNELTKKDGTEIKIKSHLYAIRSRCETLDLDLNKEQHWGWLSDVTMNEDLVDLSNEDKIILLDWMWMHWDEMTETNLRTVKKMAQKMHQKPDSYKDSWEVIYLKKK